MILFPVLLEVSCTCDAMAAEVGMSKMTSAPRLTYWKILDFTSMKAGLLAYWKGRVHWEQWETGILLILPGPHYSMQPQVFSFWRWTIFGEHLIHPLITLLHKLFYHLSPQLWKFPQDCCASSLPCPHRCHIVFQILPEFMSFSTPTKPKYVVLLSEGIRS